MDRALSNAELLSLIFEFTTQGTDACCMRVCKNWFKAAIGNLWFKVENLQKVFLILAPIKKKSQDGVEYIFTRAPTITDWERFYKYSSNVRHLIIDEKTWPMSQVLHDVAVGRIRVHLFPKLVKLNFIISFHFSKKSALFLHKGLKEVVVRINDQAYATYLGRFLTEISDRAQKVEMFTLNGDIDIRLVETQLLQTICRLKSLVHVGLPLYSNTSSIMSGLGALQHLETIEFQYIDGNGKSWGESKREHILEFNPNLCIGAFPKLSSLDLAIESQGLKHFFSMKYAPTDISTLYLQLVESETLNIPMDFTEILADACPSLTDLTLDMIRESTATSIQSAKALNFQNIRPLLKLRDIVDFTIHHPLAIIITAEDLVELSSSWLRLHALNLNPEPLLPNDPSLNLGHLVTIAQHFSFLTKLSLYLDATSVDYNTLPSTSIRLDKLKSLYFGASPINDARSVAVYLGMICSSSCTLQSKSDWEQHLWGLIDEQYSSNRESDTAEWEEVESFLQAITKAIELDRKSVTIIADSDSECGS